MKIKSIILTSSIFYITACAHSPNPAEQMLSHSNDAKKLSEQWSQGEKNIIDAKKLNKIGIKYIKQGKKQIKNGKTLISQGEKNIELGKSLRTESKAKIEEGVILKQSSENEFAGKYPGKLNIK